MEYLVRRAARAPQLRGDWQPAQVGAVERFHPAGSDHRPVTRFRLLYDDAGVHLAFDVRDRYVLCRRTEHQAMVCRDSCVEAFLQPKPDRGYFNFEVNCGGAMLVYYVTDATRLPDGGLKGAEPVAPELLARVRIEASMSGRAPFEEIDAPLDWRVSFFVPNALFERYVGGLGPLAERRWRGNFYKCADESSHPHWASWAPIGEELNFHVPDYFADVRFETGGASCHPEGSGSDPRDLGVDLRRP